MDRIAYQDAVDHVIDYLGGGLSDVVLRDAKRCVLAAYKDLFVVHSWTYLYKMGRINTTPPYSTGTVAYNATTGVFTLSGGTWPSWAEDGAIRIGEVSYMVRSRLTDTTVLADPDLRPTANVAAGTTYTIYRESYTLPEGLLSQDQVVQSGSFGGIAYTHPRSWLSRQTRRWEVGDPRCYTMMVDEGRSPRLRALFWPIPADAVTLDYIYKRAPRSLSITRATAGTLALSAGTASVTSSAAVFTQAMVGSVIRAYSGTTLLPGGGAVFALPPAFESVIESVSSPTVATCREVPEASLATAPYYVSDLVDIDPTTMQNAFLRGCEYQASLTRTLKDKPSAARAYEAALALARDADSRSSMGRTASGGGYAERRPDAIFDWSDQ